MLIAGDEPGRADEAAHIHPQHGRRGSQRWVDVSLNLGNFNLNLGNWDLVRTIFDPVALVWMFIHNTAAEGVSGGSISL